MDIQSYLNETGGVIIADVTKGLAEFDKLMGYSDGVSEDAIALIGAQAIQRAESNVPVEEAQARATAIIDAQLAKIDVLTQEPFAYTIAVRTVNATVNNIVAGAYAIATKKAQELAATTVQPGE